MNFREFLKNNIVVLDGGMGSQLIAKGLKPGEMPEYWNLLHPDTVTEIHREYFNAGSNVVLTNTFGASPLKLSDEELEKIVCAAIANAKKARDASTTSYEKFIALDVGPTGKLISPLGELDFEDAVSAFSKIVKLGVKYGVDLVVIETMSDSYETKAALLAVKENSDLPVVVSNVYGSDGKLMTGATPDAMVALVEGMGADAIGANCSLGPKALAPVIERLLECASIPVLLKPNAGLPKNVDGATVYDLSAKDFAKELKPLIEKGVRLVGGCCGTTPEYIKALNSVCYDLTPKPITKKEKTVVSSFTHTVDFDNSPVLIGERINPTGKRRFKEALVSEDMDYIVGEGVRQEEAGAHILDVNVGIPDIDECYMLTRTVKELQRVTSLPLQLDTSNSCAMESALRRYNGKALINSVSGKEESMRAIFPLAKKYGGVVVALTLDEGGIPETAEGRALIAERILKIASEYGIERKDIIFDPLAMSVSADANSANVTLEALKLVKERTGCHTSLGVSNISFGLPCRDAVNSTFFSLALSSGLSAAIMNPHSSDMMRTYYSYRALRGLDENFKDFVTFAPSYEQKSDVNLKVKSTKTPEIFDSPLKHAIVKGLKDRAGDECEALLGAKLPLDIINCEIIPALDFVGREYDSGRMFLPQLLMSAEAAKSAFERIKGQMSKESNARAGGCIVLATVEGDVHDIGKNIVKLLLENYGFTVVDLGKNAPCEAVAEKVAELHAELLGLSALMTTTVPSMQKTIEITRRNAPWCKIMVGGAVLTESYAAKIGADKYAKDALSAVRYAEEIFGK